MPSSMLRPAAVAGSFYPGDADTLRDTVDALLADALLADAASSPAPMPKALVVPHAGYQYSGPIAASAYARAARGRGLVERVIVIGPTHRVPLLGIALAGAQGFATPLGVVRVPDDWAMEQLSQTPAVCVAPEAHRWEHSVEVQLPFIQRALGDVEVVPLVAGEATGDEVADVLEALWGGPETLLVISTDLSHYLPDREARPIDAATVGRIAALDGPIHHAMACGATPLNGLLVAARRRALRPTLLDLRNSSDTAGDPDRVVGYCAFAFEEVGDA